MGEEVTTHRVAIVDAFTSEPLAGNPAGVVPDAGSLSDSQMRALARELGVSETAFLRPSERADRRLRFFSPTTEVDLCGHATIASHAHLFAEGVIDAGSHTIETNVGVLAIEVESDGTVWMTQEAPDVEEVDLDYGRVAAALGTDPATLEDVGADLPLAVASTGLPFLVVPVNFIEALRSLDPDATAIEELADEVGAAGIYAFTFDALDADSTLHGRCFAPGLGIREDPVTGTASGAVAAYLERTSAFDTVPDEVVCEQGHFVDRPGRVRVRTEDSVQVGGQAALALDGEIRVPPEEEDEIIEV